MSTALDSDLKVSKNEMQQNIAAAACGGPQIMGSWPRYAIIIIIIIFI